MGTLGDFEKVLSKMTLRIIIKWLHKSYNRKKKPHNRSLLTKLSMSSNVKDVTNHHGFVDDILNFRKGPILTLVFKEPTY